MKPIARKHILWFVLLNLNLSFFSQNENSKWYFGQYAGLDFMTNPPTALTGSVNTQEGCASAADASGNLLFYTDGSSIFNASHNVMANGSGLLAGFGSTCQEALILKKPGSTTLYYVFTLGSFGNAPLHYSIVDMSLSAGAGSVTSLNNLIYSNCYEKLTAARHSNGSDYWLIFQDNLSNFRSILLSSSGLSTVNVISNGPYSFSGQGYAKMSPDGTRLCTSTNNGGGYFLYDFNSSTGVISNSLSLTPNYPYFGCCEFSPDGTKLYLTYTEPSFGFGLLQCDLCIGPGSVIVTSVDTLYTGTTQNLTLQLAPDGKIYISKYYSGFLSVINNPNNSGNACNYVSNAISLAPNISRVGLPNFITNINSAPPLVFNSSTINNQLGCQTATFSIPTLISNCPNTIYSITAVQWKFGDPASGSSNTSTLSNPSHVFTSLGVYTVQLVINYCCGHINDTLTKVVMLNQNCLSVNGSSISCGSAGSASVEITGGTGPYTYTWLPVNQYNSVAVGIYPGTYTVFVHDQGSGITSSLIAAFASTPALSGSLAVTNSIACNGINLSAAEILNIQNGSGNYNYHWGHNASTAIFTVNPISALNPGAWTVQVSDALSLCSFVKTFNIVGANSPTLSVSPNPAFVCKGVAATLSVSSNGGNIQWSPPTGLNINYGYSVVANPSVPQTYTVTSETNGCYAVTTCSVNTLPPPAITITSSKPEYCRNETVMLSAFGANTYEWADASSETPGGQTASFYLTGSSFLGNFTVTGRDSKGCQATKAIHIPIKELPTASISTNPLQGCVPFCGQFKLITSSKDAALKSVSWQVEDFLTENYELNYCFHKSDTYTIFNKFVDTLTACSNTQAVLVKAWEKPIADFSFRPEEPIELMDDVKFEIQNNGTEHENWNWTLRFVNEEKVIRNTNTVYQRFEDAGNYPMVLVVENKYRCQDTVIKVIHVKEDLFIYVPNAFSPNEDDLNDVFMPVTRGIKAMTFQIFNRMGQKIFETSDMEKGWDGSYKGVVCKQDVYLWKLVAISKNTESEEINKLGEVLLLR